MDTNRGDAPEALESAPSYSLSEYPSGLEQFVSTFPSAKRMEVRTAIAQAHRRFKAANEWMDGQLRLMTEVPDVVFKYVPSERLEQGSPRTLRATQPSALNDVMEGNIRTTMAAKMNRDLWYEILSRSLRQVFGDETLPEDELERRKRLYGDPRVSTVIRDYLSRFVGVVSFSLDPLVPTMWAHYAQNSGFVVGYRTAVLAEAGLDLRRVIYMELAPSYTPSRDNIVRLDFVDEEQREMDGRGGRERPGVPILGSRDFLELEKNWRELSRVLFVKGEAWSEEKEVRLLVDLQAARTIGLCDENGLEIRVLDVPSEAIEEVYVGVNTSEDSVRQLERVVDVGEGTWRLRHTDSHAYRIQVTSTMVRRRSRASSRESS